jgi:hypothetical protein
MAGLVPPAGAEAPSAWRRPGHPRLGDRKGRADARDVGGAEATPSFGRLWPGHDDAETSVPSSVLCAVEHKTDAASAEHGDLLDVIRGSCGFTDFADVAAEARRFLSLPPPEPRQAPTPARSPVPAGSPEAAQRLFAMSQPIGRTLVETYLRLRGIAIHPRGGGNGRLRDGVSELSRSIR